MIIKLAISGLLESQKQAAMFERFIMRGIDISTHQEAHVLRKEIVNGLRSQAPGGRSILPLSETTILLRGLPRGRGGGKSGSKSKKVLKSKVHHSFVGPLKRGQKRPRRGHTKALIDRGDLIGGVAVRRIGWAHYTVGVHRGERGSKSGKDLVNIAEIHENGTKEYTVTVTAKMAKFSKFLVTHGILKVPWKEGSKLMKKIPARPFLGPAQESWEINASQRFETRMDIQLMGNLA